MKPFYKQVKEYKPHCSECGEKLMGNGSIMMPYSCSCGEWELSKPYGGMPVEYELKEQDDKK